MGDQEYFQLLKRIPESKPANQSGEAVRYVATLGGDELFLGLRRSFAIPTQSPVVR